MGFLHRLFARGGDDGRSTYGTDASGATEHAVIVTVKLSDEFGSPDEQARMHQLQAELAAAVERAKTGELDGDEFGEGEFNVYVYGKDADQLWEVVAPVLEKHTFPKGSSAVKRYGPPEEGVREERIDIARDR